MESIHEQRTQGQVAAIGELWQAARNLHDAMVNTGMHKAAVESNEGLLFNALEKMLYLPYQVKKELQRDARPALDSDEERRLLQEPVRTIGAVLMGDKPLHDATLRLLDSTGFLKALAITVPAAFPEGSLDDVAGMNRLVSAVYGAIKDRPTYEAVPWPATPKSVIAAHAVADKGRGKA